MTHIDKAFQSLAPLRVLLAEDDVPSSAVAIGALHAFGCRVVHVCDGSRAVPVATSRACDVVLMDCMMPVMDGLTATALIRQKESELNAGRIVIIGLTASAMRQERAACLAAGMDDVVTKPVLFHHLYSALVKWKARRQ